MEKSRNERKLGSPPGDWNASAKRTTRSSAETQRLRRADLGGPPREFGSDERPALPARREPFTALIVSEDRGAVAALTFALAEAKMAIRISFDVADAAALIEGCAVVFAVIASDEHPLFARIEAWRGPRVVVALVPDGTTAARVRGRADVTLEAPWDLEPVLASLRG